jgi:negative regulator of sigma-B (phosphoserine phosphatase)
MNERARLSISASGSARPVAGETCSGDACEVMPWSRGIVVALADGLGHGAPAADAAATFLGCVRAGLELPLEQLFAEAQRAAVRTRGVVAAVARFDECKGELELAGLGNIGVMIARAQDAQIERPVLVAGVLGSAHRGVRPLRLPFHAGDLLVMHSDGVRPRFDPTALRGLTPQGAVESVLRMHARDHDDASCVIAQAVLDPRSQQALACAPNSGEGRDIPVHERSDAECAALEARTFAQGLGFEPRAQWEVSIAASELATNIVKYAQRGLIRLRTEQSPRSALVLEAIDQGFGINDVNAAFKDGFSRGEKLLPDRPRGEGQGLGVGLGSVSRMMDTVDVHSDPARGTRIVARKFMA